MNKEVKGSSSEVEEIKIHKYRRKIHVRIISEEVKDISSEEEDNGLLKCRRRSRVEKINEEVKGCLSSSKQQKARPEPTNTKYEMCIEQMKRKVKIAALERDGFVLQE